MDLRFMNLNYRYKVALLAAVLVAVFFGNVYAEKTDLEDLRKSLKKQETAVEGNKSVEADKKDEEEMPVVYITPDKNSKIDKLYEQAKVYFKNGNLDDARQCLEEIIDINPLHLPAINFLRRVVDLQAEISFKDSVILNKERMLEVDRAWLPPEKSKDEEEGLGLQEPIKTERQKMMENRANQVIQEISFTDAHLRDVLRYLSEISGINIVVDEDLFPKSTDAGETGEEMIAGEDFTISDRITIALTNIPLIEALKYILSAKGLKFRIDEYVILVSTPERLSEVEMETKYYNLTAGMGMFTEFAKRVREEQEDVRGIARGLEAKSRITIKEVMEQSGVPFPPGSKVFLDQRSGTLIVRNTPSNQLLVEDVLRILDITPFQVEIEAKFIELSSTEAQELGLEWMVKGGGFAFGTSNQLRFNDSVAGATYGQFPLNPTIGWTGKQGVTQGLRYIDQQSSLDPVQNVLDTQGRSSITNPRNDILYSNTETQYLNGGNILSLSGILTQPQFRMILHALNQSGSANLLSSPKVTTLNNQQAQIEVVKEIIYPTEFELTPATTNDAGTVVTQPVVTPTAWTTRDIGIILNVTPSVGADKSTINLTLLPEVSDLKGWSDYGIPSSSDIGISNDSGANGWNRIPILQPIFVTKNVATNVVVHDGETVVLGGLIREELVSTEDKIPVLGDIPLIGSLFRSQTEKSKKTNLLIFVTANLLTPTGERIKSN